MCASSSPISRTLTTGTLPHHLGGPWQDVPHQSESATRNLAHPFSHERIVMPMFVRS